MSGSSSACRRTSLAAGRARWGLLLLSLAAGLWLVVAGVGAAAPAPVRRVPLEEARSKIQHVVIIMQENRSFDHYFGTYPGANGIPRDANGVPTVCNPNPLTGTCDKPFLDTGDVNYGGPHFMRDAITAIDGGKMDGFIIAAANKGQPTQDVMSYHDRGQIPNYWAYADTYLLQDNLFEPVESWTMPRTCSWCPPGPPAVRILRTPCPVSTTRPIPASRRTPRRSTPGPTLRTSCTRTR